MILENIYLNIILEYIGQQNVQMPPRPSSSQSDGSGPAPRMSHSPMTTQGIISILFLALIISSCEKYFYSSINADYLIL